MLFFPGLREIVGFNLDLFLELSDLLSEFLLFQAPGSTLLSQLRDCLSEFFVICLVSDLSVFQVLPQPIYFSLLRK
jgi:hypothetical protein